MSAEMPSAAAHRPPSHRSRHRGRWLWIALLAVALLFALAWQLAARQLQQQIVAALGPRGEVATVGLVWDGVEVTGLRIAAAPGKGWPAPDELRARRVLVSPDLWATMRGRPAVHRVRIEDGYIALLRRKDGKLQVLPSLLGSGHPADGSAPLLRIGRIELTRTEVAFFDASVRQPPLSLRLTDLEAGVGPLALPALDEPTQVEVSATVQGHAAGREGRLEVRGEIVAARRDATLQVKLQHVDLVAFQPYLSRVAEGGVKRGTLDLDLAPKVRGQQLKAPGRITLTGLELGSGGFAGLPRQALVALASRNERIELDFTLEGRLDDPAFSINENLAVRVTAALAEKMGLSVGGVVQGVGSMIKGLFGR